MRNQENKKRLAREWYLKIKDTPEHKKQKREWYLAHREEILRLRKEKNALKPKRVLKTEEEKREKRRLWVLANREKLNADSLKRRSENLVKYQQYARGYYRESLSYKNQYGRLVRDSKNRGIEVSISQEEFEKIVSAGCKYCGEEIERRGIDRVDNLTGYTLQNSAPSCKICNYMKKTMSVQDFLSHVKKIHLHNEKS